MKEEYIENLARTDQIRRRTPDKEKIKSIIESSINNMLVVKTIILSENSAILIFRETYESIRQLGDALWWLSGYEPRNHEVSMDILKDVDIKEKIRLYNLSRFKAVRNDANYRGFKVNIAQAQEILEFWDKCSEEIIQLIMQKLK